VTTRENDESMRRGTLFVAGLCFAILAIGAVTYTIIFRDGDAAAELPRTTLSTSSSPVDVTSRTNAPGEEITSFFDVIEVTGSVIVRRSGLWLPLRRGVRVMPSESIRTAPKGRAVLRAPSGDELILRERVELSADVLDETVTELTLTRGRVRAHAAATTERLRIASNGAEAIAPGGGRFTVFADSRGAVAVASEAGDIEVIGRGANVTVGSGRKTYVPRGRQPRPSEPIDDEVFLAVAWPRGEVHARSVDLEGRTQPGTEVQINGTIVPVGDDGRFSTEIPLREGANVVRVDAEAIDGRLKNLERKVVASRAPPLEVEPLQYNRPPLDVQPLRYRDGAP
jgi:hypothetical protein